MKAPIIALSSLLLATSAHAITPHNYVEAGFGASQLFSFNKTTNDNLSNFSTSPSLKLLVGSRLNNSRTAWFELGYNHNGVMKYGTTELSSQSVSTGFKFTTDPISYSALFIRGGVGRTWMSTTTDSESSENISNHYYGGAGLSFRLDYTRSIVLEAQHINDAGTDEAINGAYLSINQFF